jgi:hypothetical protein
MINNIEKILPLLEFKSEDDFYYLQILQRKKENPQLGSNSRVIKNYYITSKEHLLKYKDEIINLCEVFNARASLRLNKRSFKKVAFKAMQNIANTMSNGEFSFIKSSYDRACGLGHNDENKKWILDIDNEEVSPLMLSYINYECEPISKSLEKSKIYIILPSKNGYHIITKPFNILQFKEKYPEIDIHKDNPTNIYIP